MLSEVFQMTLLLSQAKPTNAELEDFQRAVG